MQSSEAFHRYLAATGPHSMGIEVASAEGCYITAKDGKRYLDLVAGLAVCNIGHRHPKVVESIKQQADKYLHVIPYGEFVQKPQVEFAGKLTSLLPDGLDQVYFVNSGTEAIEGALKLAKRITGCTKLIGCRNSYHGSTHGSLSITDNEQKKYRNRPLLPDVGFIRFNEMNDLELIDEATAAVVVEPVQGDAGVRVPSQEWMTMLRDRCSEVRAMLIFDEVQTGFGRTGKKFALEHFGVQPDILVLGKALGGGLPMGAFISSQKRMSLLSHDPMLGHITTFGGHPLPCVAGNAALEVLLEEDLSAKAKVAGERFKAKLKHEHIKEVRGMGLMLAVELGDAEFVQKVVHGCLDKGVLCFWFLSCPTAFRLSPPLTISEEQIDHACEVMLSVISEAVT